MNLSVVKPREGEEGQKVTGWQGHRRAETRWDSAPPRPSCTLDPPGLAYCFILFYKYVGAFFFSIS